MKTITLTESRSSMISFTTAKEQVFNEMINEVKPLIQHKLDLGYKIEDLILETNTANFGLHTQYQVTLDLFGSYARNENGTINEIGPDYKAQ